MNVEKTKGMQLLYGKKAYVSKLDLSVFCGKRWVIALFGLQNV